VALVTGAAKRVGACIARILHRRGLRVAVHYRRSAQQAGALAAELDALRPGSAISVQADLCDAVAARTLVAEVLERFGGLAVLVNNASSFYATPLDTLTEAAFDDLVGSNLKGPVFTSQAAAPALRAAGGSIVNITDIHARHPARDHAVYCAAKAGLECLTRALARDLGPTVRVNAVAPGAILWAESGQDTESRDDIVAGTALERVGEPEDIAGAVAWLALDAPYVTGQILSVDGGRTLGP
jgi:pteridine reductase